MAKKTYRVVPLERVFPRSPLDSVMFDPLAVNFAERRLGRPLTSEEIVSGEPILYASGEPVLYEDEGELKELIISQVAFPGDVQTRQYRTPRDTLESLAKMNNIIEASEEGDSLDGSDNGDIQPITFDMAIDITTMEDGDRVHLEIMGIEEQKRRDRFDIESAEQKLKYFTKQVQIGRAGGIEQVVIKYEEKVAKLNDEIKMKRERLVLSDTRIRLLLNPNCEITPIDQKKLAESIRLKAPRAKRRPISKVDINFDGVDFDYLRRNQMLTTEQDLRIARWVGRNNRDVSEVSRMLHLDEDLVVSTLRRLKDQAEYRRFNQAGSKHYQISKSRFSEYLRMTGRRTIRSFVDRRNSNSEQTA